ncbi:MAG: bifunctional UDP-sugar hydrolase/5'-nucleotidase [Pseudorhodoplanes sp.]
MLARRRFLIALASFIGGIKRGRLAATALASFALPTAARAESAKITFLLVNDIYQMGDTAMPDGKRRGGFARLAAVVKAERAKGGAVIFAHAGDTLSPSLMSGIDRGEHIVALTNMIPPDIFVPGNHEFDFGKAVFLRRMAEAQFPLFAANMRGPDGRPLPGFRDRAIVTVGGVRIGLTGAAYDDTPRVSASEDVRFLPTVETMEQQLAALRRDGADFTVAVVHAERKQDQELFGRHAADLILTGHDHDLFLAYDGRGAMVESSYDAHYVVAIDIAVAVKQQGDRRDVTWWPSFRVIDTADVTPDPEVAAKVAALEAELSREMDVALGTTAIELDSRNAVVRSREAAIGNLVADAMRIATKTDAAVVNGGSIRSGKVYAPGDAITRRDVLAELPFGNRMTVVEIAGRELKRAIENGLSLAPHAAGRFPQVSGLTIAADLRRPAGGRVLSVRVGDAPLDETRLYRVAISDFLARGGDYYTGFRDARALLPAEDGPLVANAVMIHIRNLGVVRGGVEGRITFAN